MACLHALGGKLYVTVLKANGDVVFDLREIPIAILNDYVISEPVALPPGEYTVTQFIISNGGSGTYAAPLERHPHKPWKSCVYCATNTKWMIKPGNF